MLDPNQQQVWASSIPGTPVTIPLNPFGGTNDQVKTNPTMGDPNLIEPAGPTDPQVCFISI